MNWAQGVYLALAWLSAHWLGRSSCLRGIWAHRSLASGEIDFARSDIDLILLLREDVPGAEIADLLARYQRLRRLNPLLHSLELFRPSELVAFAQLDSAWASLEARFHRPLFGQPCPLEEPPVDPIHALRRFLFWCETHFSLALVRRRQRDLKKLALECWNYYAVASGLLTRPLGRRADMQSTLDRLRPGVSARLHQPQEALDFVLTLAGELHSRLLPKLVKQRQVVHACLQLPPMGALRHFVVLPRSGTPLPAESFRPGAWTVTPELLDLYVHYRNSFLWRGLPAELGLQAPSADSLRRDRHYYADPHFLYFPGFSDRRGPHPRERLKFLAGEPQPAIRSALEAGQQARYYRQEYDSLRTFNLRLLENIAKG